MYHKRVPTAASETYADFKEAMRSALESTLQQCRRDFWNFQKKYGDSPHDVVERVDTALDRLARGCSTIEELKKEFLMGRVLSVYSST